MKNKWIRVLVCFVLVCCILVNISPIRAKAIVPIDPFTIGYVTKEVAFWAIAMGLGISLGTEAIEQGARLADTFATWSVGRLNDETVALMQDDMIQLMATGNPDMPWMVDSRLVDGVREWMFESETVTGGEVATEGYLYYNDTLFPVIPDYSDSYTNSYILYRNSTYYCVWTNGKLCYSDDGAFWANSSYGRVFELTSAGWSLYNSSFKLWTTNFDIAWGNVDVNYTDGTNIVSTSPPTSISTMSVAEGLTAHQIAPKDEDFATGYSEWVAGAVTVPAGTVGNTSDITALPIGIGKDLDETISATQQDVWSGKSTYTDTSTDAPGTDTEGGTGTGTGSGAVSGTDLSSVIKILNNIHSYQQTGSVASQAKIDGLAQSLGVTNGLLEDSNSKLASILAANAFGFETVQQSVIALPGAIGDELTDIEDLLAGLSGSLAGTKAGVLSDIIAWMQTIAQELADVKEKVVSLPTDIAEAISNAVTPSTSVGSYAMELTDFFPFCLPYDLYEFLTILRASPQAPVFTWPINVPAIGLEYEIKIDLSPWNDVAALFRKMELLAFCVGLAYVSREKFLRA